VESDGEINYAKFLDRYRIEMTGAGAHWQDAVIDHICEKMFFALKGRGTSVHDAFSLFDVDNNGKSRCYLSTILRHILLLILKSHPNLLFRVVCHLTGTIEYEEFVNTLKTMDVGLSEAQVSIHWNHGSNTIKACSD